MSIHDIMTIVGTSAASLLILFLTKLLASDSAKNLVDSFAARLAAQTEEAVAVADHSNNLLLQQAVHAAMTYAEVHEADVLKAYSSKADYVIESISGNPRFAALQVPTQEIEHLIEQLWTSYFKALTLEKGQ